MSLALGGLFYNAGPFLQNYFNQLESLEFPKDQLHLVFAVTKSSDNTETALKEYIVKYGKQYASAKIVFREKIAGEFSNELKINNVAESYKLLVEASAPHNLFIIEQDNIAPKDCLKRLIALKGDICAGITLVLGGHVDYKLDSGSVFRVEGLPHVSAYIPVKDELVPISHPTPMFQLIYMPKDLLDKHLEAGAVGTGVSFIKRTVLDKVPFEYEPAFSQDIWFCKRAREAGFKVVVDTGLWYEHYHYSYKRWTDENGRLMIYFRDCHNAPMTEKATLDLGGLCGIVIPKEEVDRQGVPIHKLKIPYYIPLE